MNSITLCVLVAACAALIYLSGQRVNLFMPRRHKFGWGLMYIAWAVGYFGLGLHLLAAAFGVDSGLLGETAIALAVGGALNLLLTYEQWRFNVHAGRVEGEVPDIAKKGHATPRVPPTSGTALSRAPAWATKEHAR